MPYIYKYNKEIEQFGLCSYRLTLTDPDGILPELSIPVLFKKNEDSKESKEQIAKRMVEEQTAIYERAYIIYEA
jgi:hypothetical protein